MAMTTDGSAAPGLQASQAPQSTAAAGAARVPRLLIFLMAAGAATSVANVYYAQPLLDVLAAEFSISQATVGGVVTATQVGSALALLFVVPLGDLINRKTLACIELGLLAGVLAMVAFAPGPLALLAGMVGLGLLGTAVTQGMIAYAATLSAPSERGRVVGLVQSGVLVGVLGSRSLAGLVADLAGWRAVFVVSALLALGTLALFSRVIPQLSVARSTMRYRQLLGSMYQLLSGERVLQIRGILGLLVFAAFGAFWSALALPLSAEPYRLSLTAIGTFGLVGIAGAMAAARAGRLADQGKGERTTCLALWCLIGAWLPIAMLDRSLPLLALGIILLDMGGQAVHVINQTMIFKTRPEMHSRLVGCYMLFYATGLGSGAIAATYAYARAGWPGVCWLGVSISAVAWGFWRLTRHLTAPARTA